MWAPWHPQRRKCRQVSLKSFDNSWGNSYAPCLLLIITVCFTCGEKKIWSNIKKSQNFMTDCSYITTYTLGDNLPPLRNWGMYPAITCYWRSVYQYNLYRGLFWFTPGTGHIGKLALFRLYLHSLGLWFTYGSAVNWISVNVSCQVPSHFE